MMIVTEEMEDRGADAYHNAVAQYKLAYCKRHANRFPDKTIEELSGMAPITPSVWLRAVFEAMINAD